jgi:hypothetical protein
MERGNCPSLPPSALPPSSVVCPDRACNEERPAWTKELPHGVQICSRIEADAEAEAETEADPAPEVARATEEFIKGRGNRGRKRKSAAALMPTVSSLQC